MVEIINKSENKSQIKANHSRYFLPIIPLNGAIALPHTVCNLLIGRDFSTKALAAISQSKFNYVILLGHKVVSNNSNQIIPINSMHKRGVLAKLINIKDFDKNIKDAHFQVECVCEIGEIEFEQKNGFFTGYCTAIIEQDFNQSEITSQFKLILDEITKLSSQFDSKIPEVIIHTLRESLNKKDYSAFISHICLVFTQENIVEQLLLIDNFNGRLDFIYLFLQKKNQSFEIEKQIRLRLEKQINQNQEEYIQSERLKAINKISKNSLSEIEKYKNKLDEIEISQEGRTKVLEELEKMENISSNSPELQVSRSYVEYLLKLPWQKQTEIVSDLTKVEKVLHQNHFGLVKVKDRIIEHLAVTTRTKNSKAPVICLVGPPGIGKTSLAHSIAQATNRKYVRMALGGLRDDNEIKGHRRTYIGSMPGKIMLNMIKAEVDNPVFLLDEIDKMAYGVYGDPASALLEILDPEQNKYFNDYYLDINYDLSKVMFIATANNLDIPAALMDRLEIIHLNSYLHREKLAIAKQHIIPKALTNNGLNKNEIHFTAGSINKIINSYTMEAGVRELERKINTVCRKVLKQVLIKSQARLVIEQNKLEQFLGPTKNSQFFKTNKKYIGKVTGLAYNTVGGDLLDIEVISTPGSGKLVYTGTLGSVMQESVKAALTIVKSKSKELAIPVKIFEDTDIHVHFPAGAIPKDGPSAGIAIVIALTSTLTKKTVASNLAMTGEVSLHGNLLAIGGLQEKLAAAVRGKVKTVILPEDNKKNLADIDGEILEQLNIHFAKNIDDVFSFVFKS